MANDQSQNQRKKKRTSVTTKLVVIFLVFSVVATLITAAMQIHAEYNRGRDLILKRMEQIENGHLKSIAATFWDVDEEKLVVQLRGLLAFPDIERLEVKGTTEKITVGEISSREVLVRKRPIIYVDASKDNRPNDLGEFIITAGLDQLKEKMVTLAITILITQGIQIFLVGAFMLLLVHVLVTKHLKKIAKYLKHLDVDKLAGKLKLDRARDDGDEFTYVVNSVNKMTEKLNQYTHELQAMIDEKTKDISSILNTIEQGIFTILPDIKIHNEYSAYLENILETGQIAGRDVMEILFKNTNLTSDSLSQVLSALVASIGEESFAFDMNSDLLVKELQKKLPSGSVKILELEWNPIINTHDITEKIIVTVRNVTEMRQLQEEAREKKRELDIIGEILGVTPDKFNEFVEFAKEILEENRRLIEVDDNIGPETVPLLFRNMHTLKGTARFYNFFHLCGPIHDVEQIYEELGKRKNMAPGQKFLLSQIDSVQIRLREYINVNEKILGRIIGENRVHSSAVRGPQVNEIAKIVNEFNQLDLNNLTYDQKFLWKKLRTSLNLIGTEKMESVLSPILDSLPNLAKDLGKGAPLVLFKDEGIYLKGEVHKLIKNLFTHVLRNSLDHGLEKPSERITKGKEPRGVIEFKLFIEKNSLIIVYKDDGRGLNLELLRRKALEKGYLDKNEDLTPDELALLIFRPGLSTSQEVSDVSGRGVGMDVVKKFLEKGQGKIRLKLLDGPVKDPGHRNFEIVMSLPKNVAVDVGNLEKTMAA